MSKIVYNSDTKIEIQVNKELKKARKGEYTTYPIEKFADKLISISFYGILTTLILTICKFINNYFSIIKNFPTTFYIVFTIISFVVFFIGAYIMCIIDEDRNGIFEIQDFLNKLNLEDEKNRIYSCKLETSAYQISIIDGEGILHEIFIPSSGKTKYWDRDYIKLEIEKHCVNQYIPIKHKTD